MKYKGPILIVLIAIVAATLYFVPETKVYKEVASVGQPAPAFEYKDSTGKLWKLSDLKGKVVIVNFWATWCGTCKSEMPQKEILFRKTQDKPVQMLGILFRDDPENLPDYFKRTKVSFPTLISPDNEAASLFGITGVPETFIIDKDGTLREKLVGPQRWDTEESTAIVEKYL